MNKIVNKNNIKDYIIVSLVKTLAEIYSLNFNIEKSFIESEILNKFKEFEILETINDDSKAIIFKNKIINSINKIIPYNNLYNNLTIINKIPHTLIGNGGFSNVYKIFNPIDNKHYAIKKIGINNNFKQALFEIRSMANLTHDNIIRYHMSWLENSNLENDDLYNQLLLNSTDNLESCSDLSIYDESNFNKFLCIQMELCRYTLSEYLNNNKDLDNITKKNIILQIAKGIEYIHNNDILHRDLKPANILINYNNIIKISDFGLACNIYEKTNESLGTIGYMAPESFLDNKYSTKSDLYSFGLIIMDIYIKFNTLMEKKNIVDKIKENNTTLITDYLPAEINCILKNLLLDNPEKRIGIKKIINLINNISV